MEGGYVVFVDCDVVLEDMSSGLGKGRWQESY